jgi:hypothetical protein
LSCGPGANRDTGAGFLDLGSVAGTATRCGQRKEEWLLPRPFGCGATLPGERPTPPRFGRASAFADSGRRRPVTMRLSPRVAGASPLRLAFAAGLFRHPRSPRFSPGGTAGLPTSRPALLPSGQERFTRDRFRSPVVRALRPPVLSNRPYRRTRRPGGLRLRSGGSPRPSGRAVPLLGGGPHPGETLSGVHGAGGSPLFSSPASFPFPVSVRRLLSDLPAGPSSGDLRAFIDSRSGLPHQPNASVRVASR